MSVLLPNQNTVVKHYCYAKKQLGQHFCIDPNIIKKMVLLAGPLENKQVLEIGPGTGNLSREILKQRPAKLIAIEKDQSLQGPLMSLQAEHNNVEILFQDATSCNFSSILLPHQPTTVIANLPYNISTVITFALLRHIKIFDKMILMFQKEVGKRLTASSGSKEYGRLSVLVNLLCTIEYAMEIPPSCFRPAPKVHSAVLVMTPKNIEYNSKTLDTLHVLLQEAFSQRRKQISNSLRKFDDIMAILKKLNLNPHLRSENLTIKNFYDIATMLANGHQCSNGLPLSSNPGHI